MMSLKPKLLDIPIKSPIDTVGVYKFPLDEFESDINNDNKWAHVTL